MRRYLTNQQIIRELVIGIAGWLCWQGFILLDIYLAKVSVPSQAFLVIISQIVLLYLLTLLGIVYTGKWGFANLLFLVLPVIVTIPHVHSAISMKQWAHFIVVGVDVFLAGIFCWGLRKTRWCLWGKTHSFGESVIRWLRQGILCILAVVAIWYYLFV